MTRANRLILSLPRSPLKLALEVVALLGLVFIVLSTALSWSTLPPSIPSHFNAAGQPDAWSSKEMILLLPAIGVILYLVMTVLSRYPHTYNYVWPITEANAPKQYQLARSLMTVLKTEILVLFGFINWEMMQVSLKRSNGLGVVFAPVFFVTIFGTIGWYFWNAYRAR